MQLMIEIDEEDYKIMKHNVEVDNPLCPLSQKEIVTKIANGIPIPEGHGRLVDIGPYEGKVIASRKYCGVNKLIEVAELDTIVEADKGDNEQNRCGNCKEFSTVSCAETYREPTENDKACECYKGE